MENFPYVFGNFLDKCTCQVIYTRKYVPDKLLLDNTSFWARGLVKIKLVIYFNYQLKIFKGNLVNEILSLERSRKSF